MNYQQSTVMIGTQNAAALGNAAQAKAIEAVAPILEQHVSQLSTHAQLVFELALRLHGLADRTLGPRPPQESAPNQASPGPANSIGKLCEAQRYMANSARTLLDAVERLEAL